MAYLVRVQISDQPGSLGSLAVALGSINADIESLDVIERGEGYAIDDLVINLGEGSLPDNIITAAEQLHGVIVHNIRPYSGSLDLLRELEIIDRIAFQPEMGWKTLVENLPNILRINWMSVCAKTTVSGSSPTRLQQIIASTGVPETLPEDISPWPDTTIISYAGNESWIPQVWQDLDTALLASPMPKHNCIILIGRTGGPSFRDNEIARLRYLMGILGTLLPQL